MRPAIVLPALLSALISAGALRAQSMQSAGSWHVVPSPYAGAQPDGNTLLAVDAISPSDAWAVGSYYNPSSCGTCPTPLAMHWDGAAWSLVSTPAIPFTAAFGYDK